MALPFNAFYVFFREAESNTDIVMPSFDIKSILNAYHPKGNRFITILFWVLRSFPFWTNRNSTVVYYIRKDLCLGKFDRICRETRTISERQ